ncbi:MAG: glutamate decarboxylase [Mucinivorans sp.]
MKTPIYGSKPEQTTAAKFKMNDGMMEPEVAYQIVHDEVMLDGNARLNLATFVTTYMDEYATRLMVETLDKNMIDKTEYPQTAEIERRCVNILADLWNSPEAASGNKYCMGTSTVGSSEACMLGGLAALKRWQAHRKEQGKSTDSPNFVISSCFQVVWEKFATFWDVEMRTVPVTKEHITLDAKQAIDLCDENTICVVPIEGVTITGLNDDVVALNDALDELNAKTGWEISIHVDAATGAFILPFVDPDKLWDFRLKWVLSISASGHKFGLVYPGVGWVVWKEAKYLPKQMYFTVNYLGAEIPSISINFSKAANQVLAQYYQFLRLGREGYRLIQQNSLDVCLYLREQLTKKDIFEFLSPETPNPLFIWKFKDDSKHKWTLYDLSDAMHVFGWQVPAYTMPAAMQDVVIMRIVARQGTDIDLAELFMENLIASITTLEALSEPTQSRIEWDISHKEQTKKFTHIK